MASSAVEPRELSGELVGRLVGIAPDLVERLAHGVEGGRRRAVRVLVRAQADDVVEAVRRPPVPAAPPRRGEGAQSRRRDSDPEETGEPPA